jgi:hypothetical protein
MSVNDIGAKGTNLLDQSKKETRQSDNPRRPMVCSQTFQRNIGNLSRVLGRPQKNNILGPQILDLKANQLIQISPNAA